jgi:hypothetical protein
VAEPLTGYISLKSSRNPQPMVILSPLSRLFCLVCLLSWVGIGAAHAQFNRDSGYGPLVNGTGAARANAPKPPPGLPGTAANRDRAVAADRTQQADLPPTEALFDAINRGDMLAARDALNRGADLNGTNVLGMTPIDQSIDLSRNDITFLLISMRNAQGGGGGGGGGAAASGSAAGTTAGKAGDKNAAKTVAKAPPAPKPAPQLVIKSAATPRPVAEVVPTRPAVGGGGNPNPQSGFLGFGG